MNIYNESLETAAKESASKEEYKVTSYRNFKAGANWQKDKDKYMQDKLIEALSKCLIVFKQLADSGNYPAPLMAANGGEGFGFITDLLESIEK